MPRFKVPQNLDMEDRIIGHLTLSQFGYLALGGMLAYFFLIKLPGLLGMILAIPIGILAFALAVIKVQDQPLPKFLNSLFRYVLSPRNRSWKHDPNSQQESLISAKKEVKKEVKRTTKKLYSASDINKVADQVDSHGYSGIEGENDE